MSDLDVQLEQSQQIYRSALVEFGPQAVVSLVSGGNDSLTAFYVARLIGVKLQCVIHVRTGCGVQETQLFVEQWAQRVGVPLMLCDAGDAYEQYVLRKGFFGRGISAHAMAYHILKATPLRKGISSIRRRRRNFPVLMLTGIRLDESDNRKYNFANQTTRRDPAAKNNIFVNIIEHWSAQDCQEFLSIIGAPRNPVSKALHRSAECMCGTMQSQEDRELASAIYPGFGSKLDALEAQAKMLHGWGWGENMPRKQRRTTHEGFELCRHCILNERDTR